MAKILNTLELYALPSTLSTPSGGYVSFGAKADGLYQKVGAVETKLATINDTVANSVKLNNQLPSYYLDWNNISNKPTSLPASDIYDWAKAATKPAYDFSEIGSKPTTLAGYGITDALASSNHTHYQLYQPNGVNPFVYTDNSANLFINGTVGIGTTTPKAKIEILKNSTISDENTGGISILSQSGDTKLVIGAVIGNRSYIQSLQNGVSYVTRPLILQPNGGTVGIGTTTPQATLDISSILFNSNYASKLQLSDTGTIGDSKTGIDWVNTAYNWKQGRISVERLGTRNDFSMVFSSALGGSLNEGLRITPGGNIGIGTAAPNASYKLDVVGTTNSSVSARAPKFDLGNGWDFRAVGTELQVFYNGVKKGAFTDTGFISTGEITAYV